MSSSQGTGPWTAWVSFALWLPMDRATSDLRGSFGHGNIQAQGSEDSWVGERRWERSAEKFAFKIGLSGKAPEKVTFKQRLKRIGK